MKINLIKKSIVSAVLCLMIISAAAQEKKKLFSGMYLQWGYNKEWYTKSTIHFKGAVNGIHHDFVIYHAKAHDRNDMDGLYKKPIEISVPQYNYRVGFYLNASHTKALEINFDHTKYIVYDNQLLHAKGFIGNNAFDTDTAFTASQMHFEHTNGANFYHINYVRQYNLKSRKNRSFITALWKAGAGILIPKTDVTLFGKRLDNRFHIAGYCVGGEGGARIYVSKHFFFEGTAKTGFVDYANALTVDGGSAKHHFGYFEVIGLVGYDIKF